LLAPLRGFLEAIPDGGGEPLEAEAIRRFFLR
jgi:hypothetical protein